MSTKSIFAVINLGSSHITAMLAERLPNNVINPIAQAKHSSMGSIVHGYIHNIVEMSQIVDELLGQLSEHLPQRASIGRVYVGIDCQSLRSHTFKAQLQFSTTEGVIVDPTHLKELNQMARAMSYPGRSVLRISEPRYFLDGKRESKPNGVRCKHIEANYQIITVRDEIKANIIEAFEKRLSLHVESILVSPIAEAMVTLNREELILGCAYINIGGGTTSISIYQDQLLTALYTLPLGGDNVTRDLMKAFKLLAPDAEYIKHNYGSMDLEIDKKEKVRTQNINGLDKELSKYEVNSYIYARMNEITANIITLIKEIDPDLQLGTIIFSGGATLLSGYEQYLKQGLSDTVRVGWAQSKHLHDSGNSSLLTEYQSVLGLVAQAKVDCVDYPVEPIETLFPTSDGDTDDINTPQEEDVPSEEATDTPNEDDTPYNLWTDKEEEEEEEDEEPDDDDNDNDDDSKETEEEIEAPTKRTAFLERVARFGSNIGSFLEKAIGPSQMK